MGVIEIIYEIMAGQGLSFTQAVKVFELAETQRKSNHHNASNSVCTPANAPEKIFLNVGFDKDILDEKHFDFNDLAEVTWSTERLSENDIEYSR